MQPDSIIVNELRAAMPQASPELRARVLAIATSAPAPAAAAPPRFRRPRVGGRRLTFALAGGGLAVVAGAAVAGGIIGFSGGGSTSRSAGELAPYHEPPRASKKPAPSTFSTRPPAVDRAGTAGSAPVPASTRRAQDYQAELHLRVTSLSNATKRALTLTKSYGGYVRSVDYGSGTSSGTAELILRVPIGSIQAAIQSFSALGTILDQHVTVRDVQPQVDAQYRLLQSLRAQITAVQKRLAGENLTDAQKTVLNAQLTRLRARLVSAQREQAQLRKQTSFATAYLELTTHKVSVAPPVKPSPGRLERALDRAGAILLRVAVVAIYVVVVGGPFALLAFALGAAGRVRRRRSTERLLASTR